MQRRFIALMIVLICFILAFPAQTLGDSAIYDWMIFDNLTEPAYTKVFSGYSLPVYQGEPIARLVDISQGVGDTGVAVLSVPADGLYEIWFTYQNTSQTVLPTEITLRLDGAMRRLSVKR